MSTPYNYTPATATGDTATVVVPIVWPFSNTITDLNVIQENTTTGEITKERDGDFTVSVDPGGASITATNFYGAGTEVTITVYRQTDITQEYGQADGEALDFHAITAQLDKMVREAQESGTASSISITELDENYLLTVDSDGNIVISKFLYDPATGILEVMDDDKLIINPGVGMSGFDFKVDGETDAASSELTGNGGTLLRSVDSGATSDVSNTEHNLSATILNLFKEATGESRPLRVWGGAAGTDRYAELKISESTDLRAVFGGDITQWDFTGNIYINGVALSAVGQANTASNQGTGAGLFKQKTGVDLEFKKLKSSDSTVAFTEDTDEVDLTTSGVVATLIQSAALFNIVPANAGVIIRATNVGAINATIKADGFGGDNYTVGDVIVVRQSGGQVTISADIGVTVNGVISSSAAMTAPVAGQIFDVMLQYVAPDTWEAVGATAAFA